MGSHVRRQIREAVVTGLKTVTAFGNRVYPFRVKAAAAVPDVIVAISDESVNPEEGFFGSSGLPVLARDATLEIQVRDKASADLDDRLDGYASSIETVMAGSALAALATEVWLTGTRIEMSGEGEKAVGYLVLTYRVRYRTVEGSAETAVV